MAASEKPLVWLRGEVKTPPFSAAARVEAGTLLRRLQRDDVFQKTTQHAPVRISTDCARRLRLYDRVSSVDCQWT